MAESTRPSKLAPGDQAPAFDLPAAAGGRASLSDELARRDAVVVLFLCNHCPYVQAYVPRLIDLQREFAPRVGFLGIGSNDARAYPHDSFEHMTAQAQRWGLNFPYLRDEDQSVARAYGAERTPEVFLLGRDGICRYEGGIDDNYREAGLVTRRPLWDAIAAVLDGRPVREPRSYAIGCTLKWAR